MMTCKNTLINICNRHYYYNLVYIYYNIKYYGGYGNEI